MYALADVNHDGSIDYAEFVPVLKRLLQAVYQHISLDWNDWCQVRIQANYYLNPPLIHP